MSRRAIPLAMSPRTFLLPLAAAAVLLPAGLRADPTEPAVPPTRGKPVLVIHDSKDSQTFNAESQDVTVQGSHNKVTITGTCHALTISGDANAVTVEKVSSISITGAGNEIQWSKALDGERPQVTDQGKTNRITHPGG